MTTKTEIRLCAACQRTDPYEEVVEQMGDGLGRWLVVIDEFAHSDSHRWRVSEARRRAKRWVLYARQQGRDPTVNDETLVLAYLEQLRTLTEPQRIVAESTKRNVHSTLRAWFRWWEQH